MGASRVHAEACRLLEIIFRGKNSEPSRRLPCKLKSNSFRVLVPQAVIGEAVSKMLVAYPDPGDFADGVRRLRGLPGTYGTGVAECIPPFDPRAIEIMAELRKVDKYIVGNDLLILAQVLADPESKFLFTRDSILLKSDKIAEIERRLHERDARRASLEIKYTL